MIFWKYIKGLNEQTPSGGTTQQLYSFLKFSDAVYDESSNVKFLPEIHINNINSITGTSVRNLGKIITSDATGQAIHQSFRFRHANDDGTSEGKTTGAMTIYFKDDRTWIQDEYNPGSNRDFFEFFSDRRVIIGSNTSVELNTKINGDWTPTLQVVGNSVTIGTTSKSANLTVKGYTQASYFDATSDKRAKTNLKPIDLAAIDLIRNTPVYSFTYKDSDLPSIGIIAQDVQNIQIGDFKLVDNEQATGQDYDYMSIHESKLTYILWKAVQEQQEQIELLKKEIDELKKRG